MDRLRDEATVTRVRGSAPAAELERAVRLAGYSAHVIPLMRLELAVPHMDCEGCSERVRAALDASTGVRGVRFPSRTRVVVFYDGRRQTPRSLERIVQSTGLACHVET